MSTLLVTGASGQLGRLVIAHLLDTLKVPAERVVAVTRKPESLVDWAARGVTVRAGDFEDPASLATAFAGGSRLLLISTDALGTPGLRLAQHLAAVNAAEQAGVAHVVYTSMPKPEGSPIPFAPDHAGTEAALAASALPGWTVLRNGWYFENLLHSLPHVLATGQWYHAAGDGKIANIARDDLARAAAVALASTFEGKRTLTLTGATPRSTAELAALIGEAVGKPIAAIDVPVEAIVQGMVGAGLPEPIARIFASFDVNTAEGRVAEATGEFEALTGVSPQPFEAWLAANMALLAGLAH